MKFDTAMAQAWIAHWEAVIDRERELEAARKDTYSEDDVQEMYETMMEED